MYRDESQNEEIEEKQEFLTNGLMPETDEKHSNQPERLSSTSKWADAIWPEPMQPPKDSK